MGQAYSAEFCCFELTKGFWPVRPSRVSWRHAHVGKMRAIQSGLQKQTKSEQTEHYETKI